MNTSTQITVLSDIENDAIHYAFYRGLEISEIARIMDMSIDTVRKIIDE